VGGAVEVNKQHTAELEVAQQATLQEAQSVRQTFQEDKKVFAVVAAALVSLGVAEGPWLVARLLAGYGRCNPLTRCAIVVVPRIGQCSDPRDRLYGRHRAGGLPVLLLCHGRRLHGRWQVRSQAQDGVNVSLSLQPAPTRLSVHLHLLMRNAMYDLQMECHRCPCAGSRPVQHGPHR
jgi:hypothetical protein